MTGDSGKKTGAGSKGYAFLLVLISFILFLPWIGFSSPNGDTYTYASYLNNPDVQQWDPIIHIGYYLAAKLLYLFLKIFHVSPAFTLAVISFISAILAGLGCFFLIADLMEDNRKGFIAALVLLISGFFWTHAMYGEVYMPQLGTLILAMLLLVKHRPLAGALIFFLACSITPTSALILGFAFHLVLTRKISFRELGIFVLPAAVAGCVCAIWKFQAVVGILQWASYDPRTFLGDHGLFFLPVFVAGELIRAIGKSFGIFAFFALIGLGYFAVRRRTLFLHIVFTFLPFILYIFNLGLLIPEHLCIVFPLIAMAAAEGLMLALHPLGTRGRYITGAILFFIYITCNYFIWIQPVVSRGRQMEKEVKALSALVSENAAIIAPYHYGVAYWHFTKPGRHINMLRGTPYLFIYNERGAPHGDPEIKERLLEAQFWINRNHLSRPGTKAFLEDIFRTGKDIYLIDLLYKPSRYIAWLLPERTVQKREELKTWLPRLDFDRGDMTSELVFDSSLWPVYRLKTGEGGGH